MPLRPLRLCAASLLLLAGVIAAGPAAAERVLYASANGRFGYFNGQRIEAPGLAAVLSGISGALAEKTVVQLLAGEPSGRVKTVFRDTANPCLFPVRFLRGTETAPLVIRGIRDGARWVTWIEGDSIDDIVARRFSCEQRMVQLRRELDKRPPARRETISRLLRRSAAALAETRPLDFVPDHTSVIRCIHVEHSSHVVFEHLAFKDCWPAAIAIGDSSNVAVRNNYFEGGTYPVHAVSVEIVPENVYGFELEGNVWVQDASGYGKSAPPPCRDPVISLDCPGRLWSEIPWGVAHDTLHYHMNGGLFGSLDIGGTVTFRGNRIANAYNGIRMNVTGECLRDSRCRNAVNRDVTIVGNEFVYVRDNPVEPEGRAVNWIIARNVIRNSHAWFSFDGVSGGPIFVWGNVGWYTDIPARHCRDGFHWLREEQVDLESGGYKPAAADHALTCATSRFGTVLKDGAERAADVDKDLYVFHNSFYTRTPILRMALIGRLKYWNNAVHFTSCGPDAGNQHSLCRIEPTPVGDAECKGYRDFFTAGMRSMLLKCVSPTQPLDPGAYDFRYNLHSLGFPEEFVAVGDRRATNFAADPRFAAPQRGDFRLLAGSPAIGAACVVAWKDAARTALECRAPQAGAAADIGAYGRDSAPYAGPDGARAASQ